MRELRHRAHRHRVVGGSGSVFRLLAAWLLVCAGGWACTIAISIYAVRRFGVMGAGVAVSSRLVVSMIAAPVAGIALDRRGHARIVAVSTAIQAATLVIVAALIDRHAVFVVIVVGISIAGAAGTASRPGLQALVPVLSRSSAEAAHATAIWGALDSVGFLLGAAAGGAAVAWVGPSAVVAAGGVTSALAAVIASSLPARAGPPGEARRWTNIRLRRDALAGLRRVLAVSPARTPYVLFAGLMVVEGTTDIQLVALSRELHIGTAGAGLLFTLWGAGGLISSLMTRSLTCHRRQGFALASGAVSFGLALVVVGAGGSMGAIVAMPVVGIAFGVVESTMMSLIPQLTDSSSLGRAYGLSEAIYAGGVAVGTILAPPLIAVLGPSGSLTAVGAAFALCSLCGHRACAGLDVRADRRPGHHVRRRAPVSAA